MWHHLDARILNRLTRDFCSVCWHINPVQKLSPCSCLWMLFLESLLEALQALDHVGHVDSATHAYIVAVHGPMKVEE